MPWGHPRVFLLVAFTWVATACSGAGFDEQDEDDFDSAMGAAGPGDPRSDGDDLEGEDGEAPPVAAGAEWPADPCKEPPPPGYQVVMGTDGDDVINLSDKPGNHMIIAGAGNDIIYAGPGNDIVCAGPGRDLVYGQEGDDYIDGGYGNDELHGNNGHDVIHGRAGSDTIYGEGGWDRLYGDLLDDRIFGGAGNDLIVGGHGTDFMHGGEGDDWLRGDTNGDQFVGGAGVDVASFTTATPPGQAGFGPNPPEGIDANLALAPGQPCAGKDPQNLDQDIDYPGCAWGDGRDGLMGIEIIVGSSFDDVIVGGPGANVFYGGYGNDAFLGLEAADQAFGGPGQDTCNGSPCDEPGEPPMVRPIVFVDPAPMDLGLVFLGGDGGDYVVIERYGAGVRVTEMNGQPLAVGAHCHHADPASPHVVDCELPYTIGWLLAWGGAGDDFIQVKGEFHRDFTAHIDGGPGNDVLHGGPGQDIIFAGQNGHDQLFGHEGDDALISESTDGDLLNGGPGDDQLVSNYPCAGHVYKGGPGQDIAGFARVGTNYRVFAQLGGPAQNASYFHGRAFSPGTCGQDPNSWTVLEPGLEILEGGSLDDVLFGDDGPNIIWGRDGNDEIRGYGGNDVLDGHSGNDDLYGGPGRDILRGGGGYDRIFAKDGESDLQISCGAQGGKLASFDPGDPSGSGCD